MKSIRVKINRSDRRDKYHNGYKDGDELETALIFQVYDASLRHSNPDDLWLCEATFHALNSPECPSLGTLTHERIKDYHTKYPSLSVGDVLVIGRNAYACETIGWRHLENYDYNIPWVPSTEVAKIVRKVLKKEFPETRFSVRTRKYAGGASIDVEWWDGPVQKEVEAKVGYLQAYSHMDITDYVHTKTSLHEGVEFSSGARYIFCKRKESKAFLEHVAREVIAKYELDREVPKIRETEWWANVSDDSAFTYFELHGEEVQLADLIHRAARETDARECSYQDQPDIFQWTDDEGNEVTSTYYRGKVKSVWEGGKHTESVDSQKWEEFKEELRGEDD
ncbi:MAG: hypothetical protein GTO24_21030 [candidate division Zixibacteria bacterium]|nr:hypothetical protein [candidate division Zixibacteria bacterium]